MDRRPIIQEVLERLLYRNLPSFRVSVLLNGTNHHHMGSKIVTWFFKIHQLRSCGYFSPSQTDFLKHAVCMRLEIIFGKTLPNSTFQRIVLAWFTPLNPSPPSNSFNQNHGRSQATPEQELNLETFELVRRDSIRLLWHWRLSSLKTSKNHNFLGQHPKKRNRQAALTKSKGKVMASVKRRMMPKKSQTFLVS